MGWKLTALLHYSRAGQQNARSLTPDEFRELTTLVFYLVFVLIALVFGIFAIRRWAVRYRASTTPVTLKPTRTSDVWGMHKAPEMSPPEGPSADSADDTDDPGT